MFWTEKSCALHGDVVGAQRKCQEVKVAGAGVSKWW